MKQVWLNCFQGFLLACVAFSASLFLLLLGFLLGFGAQALSLEFVLSEAKEAGAAGGVLHQIVGSLILVGAALPISFFIALPLALWRSSLGNKRAHSQLASIFDTALLALHGVPSIVWGLFGFAVLVRFAGLGKSWLAGSITLGLLGVPFVLESALVRLSTASKQLRDAGAALGLTQSQFSASVMLPFGLYGALSGLKINASRLLGETAPIMLTACVFSGVSFPTGVVNTPVLSLPYHIYVLAQESYLPAALRNAWGAGLVLVFMAAALRFGFGQLQSLLERRHPL